MPVYSGPRSLKITMHITGSESPLQILFPNPHNGSWRQVTITPLQRDSEEDCEDSWWQSRNCLKGRTNSLSIFSLSNHWLVLPEWYQTATPEI